MGRVYSFSFTDVAVTQQQDLFQIEAVTVPVRLMAVYLGQILDVGDAQAEGLSILIRRFTDTVTDVSTEVKLDGGDGAANAKLNVNQTTELVTGVEVVHADVWQVHGAGYIYLPPPELRPLVQIGNGIAVNLNTTPADSITMSGTCYFEEMGY